MPLKVGATMVSNIPATNRPEGYVHDAAEALAAQTGKYGREQGK